MKSLLFLLALGLASSDKLDRSYLPPPGSKFSGGSPGSIEVPLEFPKETYSTTLRPLTPGQKENGIISPGDSQLTVGIDRGTGLQNRPTGPSQNLGPVTPGPNAPFTYFQNSYKVPTTTTSYAFTQTTTFPPSEGFETTINPIDATGFPTDGSLSNLQQQIGGSYPQNQGQTFTQNGQVFPGYPQPHAQITGQQPGFVSGQQTGLGFQPQIPGSQNFINGRPDFNQFQQGLRPSSTISPISDGPIQSPGFVHSPFGSQGLTQHLGVQPPRQFSGQPGITSTATPQFIPNYQQGSQQLSHPTQFTGQENTPSNQQISTQFGGYPNNIQETSGLNIPQQHGGQLPTQFPVEEGSFPSQGSQGIPSYQLNANQYSYPNIQPTTAPGSNIPQQFNGQQSTFPSTSAQSISVSQPGVTQFGENLNSIPGTFVPDSNVSYQTESQRPVIGSQQGSFASARPQGIPSFQQGPNQYGGDLDTIQGAVTPGSNIPQSGPFQQEQPDTNNQLQASYNQYQGNNGKVSQFPNSTTRPTDSNKFDGDSQNIYIPSPAATSAVIPPRYSNQSYAGTTPTPTYGTALGNNPLVSYPSNYDQGLALRPDRPQAESDRSAVILDYKNILTPNGFEYSFDTSNGIHADENGTAVDGVKAEGSYSYIGDDGKVYNVIYTADENGFRPHGDHLPTSPPIPEAIQRVIEQAAREKEAGITHDGSYDDTKYGHKKYQGLPNHYRPQIKDKIIANGADIPNDTETRFPEGGKKKNGYQGIRKPISTSEDIPDEYDDETNGSDRQIENAERDSVNIKQSSLIPTRRPSNKNLEEDQYEDIEDGITPINSNNKPTLSITKNMNQYNSNKGISRRRHPMKQGMKDRYINSKDEYDEYLEKYENFENEPSLVTDRNNPLLPQKNPYKSGTKYVENEDDDLPEDSFVTVRPKGAKRPGYSSVNNNRKESNQKLNNNNLPLLPDGIVESDDYFEKYQKPDLPVSGRPKETVRTGTTSNTKYNESGRPRRPGIVISQDDELGNTSTGVLNERPISEQQDLENDQRHSSVAVKYSQQNEEESGYQYIPPKNKFTQSESNRFPSRFHEIGQVSSSQRPSTQYEKTDKKTTAQPFMTPNVYRHDDESYEDTNDQTQKQVKTSGVKTTSAPFTSTEYENYEKEFEEDQKIDDEIITPSQLRPEKPSKAVTSSTRRPLYEQQTTARPDDQYTFTGQDRITQKGKVKPQQRIEGLKRPNQSYSPESSTTPMPSRIFGSTQPEPYTIMTTHSQYPMTYGQETTVTNKTTTAGRPGNQRVPGRPSSKPISVYSEENIVPSYTTSKPKPTSILPGRPTSAPTTDYPYGMKLPGSTTLRPGAYSVTSRPTAANYVNRTTAPGSVTIKPGSFRLPYDTSSSTPVRPETTSRILANPETTNSFNLPSTTYRPNYSFTDKVTQLAQPNQIGQTEQPGKPGYNVNQFGRPALQLPGQPTQIIGQFGRPQSSQPGQLNQQGKTVDQFGRPQLGQPEQLGQSRQPGQSGQPGQPRRPGQQKTIINQFGRPSTQPGQQEQLIDQVGRIRPGQIGQIDQPGNTVTQFENPQPGQAGVQRQPGQQGQTIDQFGRPQSSLPGEQGQTLNQFGRPQSGQQRRPGQPDSQGQSVDQFGRLEPGQPGSPGQLRQPDQLGKTVDQFGRIIPSSQPGTGFIGSTTYHPDYSITPTQGPIPTTTYKNSGILSNQSPGSFDTFKPTEPRFGGQVPSGNGEIQGQTPSLLGPYGGLTSMERVIGEDFSGPKQPQRFDPETGYHY